MKVVPRPSSFADEGFVFNANDPGGESGMEIRQAGSGDLALLGCLNRDVQALHALAHPDLFQATTDDQRVAEWFSAFLAEPGATALIGEVAGQAVGFALGKVEHKPVNPFRSAITVGLVDQLSVRPAHQHHGYGGQLLDALIARFRQAGVRRVELSVWSFNEQARNFYRQRGFTTAQERMVLPIT